MFPGHVDYEYICIGPAFSLACDATSGSDFQQSDA